MPGRKLARPVKHGSSELQRGRVTGFYQDGVYARVYEKV
jgi:hypothetical protein